MSRNLCYTVLCLRVRPTGESNREAWFLSAEEGIFKATVFGGPKSKLRSQVSPFNQGKLWVYRDPVRDSRKVSDFDVQSWRPGLRELYERTMAADSLAETVLATHAGGGSWETSLKLAGDTLDCLENSGEKTCQRVLLHFFWAWTGFLGVKPDLLHCASCACEAPADGILWYNQKEGNLLCGNCRAEAAGNTPFNSGQTPDITAGPGARRWLLAVENLEPKDSLRYSLDNVSFHQARALVLSILTESLGKRLSLWDY